MFTSVPPDLLARLSRLSTDELSSPGSGGWVCLLAAGQELGAGRGPEKAEGGRLLPAPCTRVAAGGQGVEEPTPLRASLHLPVIVLSSPKGLGVAMAPGGQPGVSLQPFSFLGSLAKQPLINLSPHPQVEGAGYFLPAHRSLGSIFVAQKSTDNKLLHAGETDDQQVPGVERRTARNTGSHPPLWGQKSGPDEVHDLSLQTLAVSFHTAKGTWQPW